MQCNDYFRTEVRSFFFPKLNKFTIALKKHTSVLLKVINI